MKELIMARLPWWTMAGLSLGAALLGVWDTDASCFLGGIASTVWFTMHALGPQWIERIKK